MIGYQDDILASYRKSCTDLRERLRSGFKDVYRSDKNHYVGNFLDELTRIFEKSFETSIIFERKLLNYVKIKQEYQNENKSLQMKIKELQLELRAKNTCLLKLKNDKASDYVHIEFLRKHNEKLVKDLEDTRRELKKFHNSQDWLQKYLHKANNYTKDERKVFSLNDGNENITHNNEVKDPFPSNLMLQQQINTFLHCHNENDVKYIIFHSELMKICHENNYLKQALRKLENMNMREANLNRIFKLERTKLPIPKFEETDDKLLAARQNFRIHELNDIIDDLKMKLSQMELEKRNMQCSVFRIREYFMKMKDIQTKLNPIVSNENHSSTFPQHGKVLSSSGNRKFVQELMDNIKSLKVEKIQMEEDHYDELSKFKEKFGEMQFIMDHMKTVCDNTSEDSYEEILQGNDHNCLENNGINISKETMLRPKSYYRKFTEEPCSSKFRIRKEKIVQKLPDVRIQYLIRKIRVLEEKYNKISFICTGNLQILKELDNENIISQLRNIKVQTEVNTRQQIEQKKRFEKYRRFLLSTIKQYRQSCISKDKQITKLLSSFVSVPDRLKLIENGFSMHEEFLHKGHKSILLQDGFRRVRILLDENHTILKPDVIHDETKSDHHCLYNQMISTKINDKSDENHSISTLKQKQQWEIKRSPSQIEEYITSLQYDLKLCDSVKKKLQKEKIVLQAELGQRDILLSKILYSFKQRMEDLAVNVNEKYFLQRLCNDLRSVNKLYGSQNEVLKEVLENNNICPKSFLVRKLWNRKTIIKEECIQELLTRQRQMSTAKDDFCDIQMHLDSMKNDISLIQNVLHKR